MSVEISATTEYHKWYYDTSVWQYVEFLGVPCYKSVSDMWNYQEIMAELKPAMVVEFGTRFGGSALYFSVIGKSINPDIRILSVDISQEDVYPQVHADPAIQLVTGSSIDPNIAIQIAEMRSSFLGKVFFILDSDHSKEHVLAEMELLRSVIIPGDYLIVEDGNINGHPVLPEWGEGPFEAIEEYFNRYPNDYLVDAEREAKFGFTFAPSGFLIKS